MYFTFILNVLISTSLSSKDEGQKEGSFSKVNTCKRTHMANLVLDLLSQTVYVDQDNIFQLTCKLLNWYLRMLISERPLKINYSFIYGRVYSPLIET